MLKTLAAVRAIAKRLVLRQAAAAERNQGSAGQAELPALRINNRKFAFYTDRAVVHDRDLCHGTIVTNRGGYFGGTGFCVGFWPLSSLPFSSTALPN